MVQALSTVPEILSDPGLFTAPGLRPAEEESVIIDDRDGSKELIFIHPLDELAILSRLDCTGCHHHPGERQAIGDVSITGNGPDGVVAVGVEVKSTRDMLDSMQSGRLGDQLTALVNHYDERWLLTYGSYRPGPLNQLEVRHGERWRAETQAGRPVPFGYLEGYLLTSLQAGVVHKHVHNEAHAAQWLAVLERWWGKDWDEHKAFRKLHRANIGIIPDVSPDMQLRMRIAANLPGVGWERALAAAVSFPTVKSMINASEREWLEVPGIGKVIAKSIVRAVNG